jgi:transcriptional regulator GlxA family with amidase domain
MFVGFRPKRKRLGKRRHLVAVVAFDGVVLGDLSTPCEIFGLVRGRDGDPLYDVRICSLTREVKSEHVTLRVPWRLSSLTRADTVIVPGIADLDLRLPEALLLAIRRAVDRRARVASICSGAFVLAATGALDGLRATTHWRAASELGRRYPAIDVDADVLYVDNGTVLTSAGAAAGFDLCLHLVRRDLGAKVASEVARAAVMPLERAGGQAQFIVHEPPAADPSSIGQLLTWIVENPSTDLSLPVIARRAAMSIRTLSRHFRAQVGTTPADWIARARVRRAQALLETTQLAVERVAAESGFGSAAVMRQRFAEIVGTTPLAYRRAFSRREGQRPPVSIRQRTSRPVRSLTPSTPTRM